MCYRSSLIITVPKQPTNVKVSPTDNSSVFKITWEIKESPGLGYFTVLYKWNSIFTHSPHIPATSRSYHLVIEEPTTAQELSVEVVPYGVSGNMGIASTKVKITVSPGNFSVYIRAYDKNYLINIIIKFIFIYCLFQIHRKFFYENPHMYPL